MSRDSGIDGDSPSEDDAVAAFERLGLTSYEAKVFIALHRLGSGTARDVADVVDVPRSQVYSVAEDLEDRGLLEVQRSTPIRYRPVGVEEARELLRNRFEAEQDRAFTYVETVQREGDLEETREDIWTIRGRDRVSSRVVELLADADGWILYGARLPELLTDEIHETIADRAADGVDVMGLSRDESVRERLNGIEGVRAFEPEYPTGDDDRSGRIAVADDDTILLSVIDDDGTETAIWSADTLFASVLIQLVTAGSQFSE
ncbi:TrmB family transcriptional regulator [Natrialbaceae archaeon GCM10025810]|uniref:TrmB family transcriptional regulator n=1 Tax=Halovalidus salilacus TaxID=3075124 RepID=UPI00361DEC13